MLDKNKIVSIFISLLIGIWLFSTVFIVDQRQYAAVFSLGELKRVIEQPGLKFKLPFPFQTVQFFERRILTIDTPDAERFITAEKKNLLVDSYVKWRIIEPRKFFISFRDDERMAQDRLNQLIKSALNEEFTKRTIREVIALQREQVMHNIRKKVSMESADIGIEIVDVRLKRIDLLPEISDSVFRRMEAERKRVANEQRSIGFAESEKIRADAERQRDIILAEAYRDAQKIKGFGDAKATTLYTTAFSRDPQFAKFYKSLEAYRSSFKTKQDILIIKPDTEFLKYFQSSR